MKNPNGYTLIEFIVTMALLAIIMPALTLSFRTTLDASERIDRRTLLTAEARAVLPVITQDLQNAFVLDREGTTHWLIGTDSLSGDAPADSLTLTTMSGRPPLTALVQDATPADTVEPLSPIQQVNYSLEPGSEEGTGLLIRSFSSPPGEDPTATTDAELLSDRVIGFDVQYFDGTEWHESWDTTQPDLAAGTNAAEGTQTPILPLAVRVSLTLLSPNGPQTYNSLVNLPMAHAYASRIEQENSEQGNGEGNPAGANGPR